MILPLISVIIPVYNADKYIGKMVESILTQSFNNFELILINDGSLDDSIDICQKYADIDSRIIIIDKKNEGPSATRNLGIGQSRGQYIIFLDADDFIEPTMFMDMVNEMELRNSDIVISGFFTDILQDGKLDSSLKVNEQYIFLEDNIKAKKYVIETMMKNSIIYGSWNKLYKSEIIKKYNVKFRNDIDIGEDLLFNLDYLSKINSLSMLDKCYYHYLQYNSGNNLMMKYRENKFEIMSLWYEKLLEFIYDIGSSRIDDYVNWLRFRWTLSSFISIMSAPKAKKEKINYIKNILINNNLNASKSSKYIGFSKFIIEKIICLKNPYFIYFICYMVYMYKTKFKKKYLKKVNSNK